VLLPRAGSETYIRDIVQLLMKWWYSTPAKSQDDLQKLVDDVIFDEDFNWSDLADFNVSRVLKELMELTPASSNGLPPIPPCLGNAICPAKGWAISSV
jgi:hypothetical protein